MNYSEILNLLFYPTLSHRAIFPGIPRYLRLWARAEKEGGPPTLRGTINFSSPYFYIPDLSPGEDTLKKAAPLNLFVGIYMNNPGNIVEF